MFLSFFFKDMSFFSFFLKANVPMEIFKCAENLIDKIANMFVGQLYVGLNDFAQVFVEQWAHHVNFLECVQGVRGFHVI